MRKGCHIIMAAVDYKPIKLDEKSKDVLNRALANASRRLCSDEFGIIITNKLGIHTISIVFLEELFKNWELKLILMAELLKPTSKKSELLLYPTEFLKMVRKAAIAFRVSSLVLMQSRV